MNKIEFLKENKIKLNGITYKGYSVCNLPSKFGQTEDILDSDGNVVNRLSLVDEWFNYRGLTYIIE